MSHGLDRPEITVVRVMAGSAAASAVATKVMAG